MAIERISTDHPDLAPVLGALDDEQRARVVEQLEAADAQLVAVRDKLAEQTGGNWETEGVVLETADSGQTSLNASVEEAAGMLIFAAQLRPRNFFPSEEGMWQPGRPPLRMATDAWDVEGNVDVRFKTRVAGRPYTILETVVELEERRFNTPEEAVGAFAAMCGELAELALSREATVATWRPEEEAAQSAPSGETDMAGSPGDSGETDE